MLQLRPRNVAPTLESFQSGCRAGECAEHCWLAISLAPACGRVAGAIAGGLHGARTTHAARPLDERRIPRQLATDASIDDREVAQFSRSGQRDWWDERGADAHAAPAQSGAARLYPRSGVASFRRATPSGSTASRACASSISAAAAGILSEPLARLGARVVGADPSAENIAVARAHATAPGLAIDYRCTTAEALADAGERFDLVLAMEVVEHVADLDLFVRRAAEMVKPGGLMIARHHQPHVQELRPRDRRRPNMCSAGCRAAPIVGQVRHAGRTRERDGGGGLRAIDGIGVIYDIARRRLAALARHGRELHADGGGGRE